MLYPPQTKEHNPAMFGLDGGSWEILMGAFSRFSEIERVVLFGSRATGTADIGADIDLAVYGRDFTHGLYSKLCDALEESKLRYFVDIVVPGLITSKELLESIDRQGVLIYQKEA